MDIDVRVTSLTGDWRAASNQVAQAFGAALDVAARELPATFKVHFALVAMNPLGLKEERGRRPTFHVKTQTYFFEALLTYAKWITPNWSERVGDVAEVLSAAMLRAARTRLKPEERDALIAAIQEAGRKTSVAPPSEIIPLGAVALVFEPGSDRPGVSYTPDGPAPFGPRRFERIEPAQVQEMQARYFAEPAPESSFKLYDAKRLSYREAWMDEGVVVEHWGVCGTEGETRRHLVASEELGLEMVAKLREAGEQAGYAEVAIEDHGTIVLQASTGPDVVAALDLRHEFERYLDQLFGWTGLGHCDGGDLGGGVLRVFCFVVDKSTALKLLGTRLPASEFAQFSVVREP